MLNFFFPENRAVYEIVWENMVEPDRPHVTILRMHVACWIIKATNTHSCSTYCFSMATVVTRTQLTYVYTYIACLVLLHSVPTAEFTFMLSYLEIGS